MKSDLKVVVKSFVYNDKEFSLYLLSNDYKVSVDSLKWYDDWSLLFSSKDLVKADKFYESLKRIYDDV